MLRKPPPKFSRRWPVISTMRLLSSSTASGESAAGCQWISCWCLRIHTSASITVLPVTSMLALDTPSRSRLSWLMVVGAKCRSAITPVRCRLASSGHGARRLPVRNPASTWPMGN
ncbi:hypothetical protein D3C78_1708050 [compost metagenome]